MPPPGKGRDPLPAGFVLLFVCLAAVILIAGVLFYQVQEQQVQDSVTRGLSSIALLKAEQIAVWRSERLGDAAVLSRNRILVDGVQDYLASSDPAKREKILLLFDQIALSYHYRNVLLVDPEGRIRISRDPSDTAIGPGLETALAGSLAGRNTTLTDLSFAADNRTPQMYAIAPLIIENGEGKKTSAVGAIILVIDPATDLYPLVQSWPVPSDTAETLLVERDDDHVLYLNELRHQHGTALNLTIPLSRTDLPAVAAVQGTTGAFAGRDYRDIEVISFLEPVPGSPWFLVAKVDRAEAFAPWSNRSSLIISLVAGTLIGAVFIVGLFWQRRQKYHYRTLYAAETGRREEEARNRVRLETLLRLSDMGSAAEQELADYVLDAACRLTESPLAFIGTTSPDETVFETTAWSGTVMEGGPVPLSPVHFPVTKAGIWVDAVRNRQPVIVNDCHALPAGRNGLPAGHVPVTRLVSVPVFEGERIVMVAAVANKDSNYTKTDVDNLTLLMQGVRGHLRKLKAEEALRQKTTDLEAANEEITAADEELRANYEKIAATQEALSESERKYRNLYHYAQVGLFETSFKDGTIVACNQRYADLAGFASVADASGKAVLPLYVNPEDRTEVGRILRETGFIENHTVKFRNQRTGKIFWGQFSARFNYERDVAEGTIIDITVQKEAEQALRETEQRFRTLVEQLPLGIAMTKRNTGGESILYYNRTFTDMTGYTLETTPTLDDWILQAYPDPEYRQQILTRITEIYREAGRDITSRTYETHVTCRDGAIKEIEFRYTDLKEFGFWTLNDVTDHKRAEEKIRISELRYRRLFESAKDGILILNRDTGRIIDANPFIESLLGYAPNDLLGKYLWDIGLFKDQILSKVAFGELQAKEYLRYEDLPLETLDGKRKDVEFVSNVYPVDAKTSVIQCNIRDITERKAAEDALQVSEEKYRILFTRMIEGSALHEILYNDSGEATDYRILDVNPSYESILGLRREAVVGKTSREAYSVDTPPFLDVYAGVAATGRALVFEEYFAPLKKHFSISVYSPGKGRFATIFEDITARKEAAGLREKLIRELEQKNAELERFTYTVSHDLKSPLITIKGFAGLLEDDALNGDQVQLKKDIRRIITAANTMQELLADVLELSRIGNVISPPEKTPFGTIAREAVDLLAGPLADRGVWIDIAPDLPVVSVDHARIREALVNLIENAIKFLGSQQNPVIRIGVEMDGATPVFFVQDNGMGIDPRYLERIFNLFERLDVSTPGTGIGLPIVRRIIETHGGRIWAESEGIGKGATFRFTLPAGDGNFRKRE